MLMTPIWPKMIARPSAINSSTEKVLRPLKACMMKIENVTTVSLPCPSTNSTQTNDDSLVAFRKRIGLDQVRFVNDLVLTIELRLPDAQLAPQVVVGVHLHVAFWSRGELEAR